MSTVDATIDWIAKLPEQIGEKGEQLVMESIKRHGHIVTGRLLASTNYEVDGFHARIWVWTKYAKYVNDGRGAVKPRNKKALYWYLPEALPHPVMNAAPYEGSHFFDEAYKQLDAYCSTL